MSIEDTFVLHARLAADSVAVGEGPLSRVLMMNDARYHWLILVPRRPDLREIMDLSQPERSVLIEEVARAGAALKEVCGAEKLNVGALGNLVPQLHIHVVARFAGDPAWPGPVWGHSPPVPMAANLLEMRIAALRARL